MNLPDLSRLFVNGFGGEVVEVGGADVVRGGKESARVAPESAAAGEARWNRFLTLLVEVLAEVARRTHVPCNEVAGMEMKREVLGAVGLGDSVP